MRNGVGVYTPPAGQPVVTGTSISSTVFNTLVADLANALTTSIATDGQTPMAANLPMGGFKITGLGAATVAGDAIRFEQIGVLAAAAGANADITSLAGPVSTVNGQTLLHFNDIINGNFVIAQAGTSFAPAAANSYDLDGWLNGNSSTAIYTVAQVAGSTAGRSARQTTITTAKAGVAAGDAAFDETRIEGYNIEKYVGSTFTISFRARVPTAGIHCVSLRNAGADRSYVVEINFPTANVYQNCSFTVVGGLTTAGTWNYTNGFGISISFTRMCGTTYQTTPNAWQVGNFIGTVNQINDCAILGNVWALEKVTLNLGTVAAVSEISFEAELIRCMRYYEILRLVVTVASYSNAYWKVTKRGIPSLTLTFDSGAGASVSPFASGGSSLPGAGLDGIFQNAPHSINATAAATGSTRL